MAANQREQIAGVQRAVHAQAAARDALLLQDLAGIRQKRLHGIETAAGSPASPLLAASARSMALQKRTGS